MSRYSFCLLALCALKPVAGVEIGGKGVDAQKLRKEGSQVVMSIDSSGDVRDEVLLS